MTARLRVITSFQDYNARVEILSVTELSQGTSQEPERGGGEAGGGGGVRLPQRGSDGWAFVEDFRLNKTQYIPDLPMT